ncbi:MAG: nucleotidyltransferase domain-containing protein [bacterium]|nr:nucleotidyltransferase domain-containing protein [bacterium]
MKIPVDNARLADFCRRHHIRKLAFFGSVLRDSFSPQSDVDVLVEFAEDAAVGLIRLSAIERELSALLGRKADLNTPGFLNRSFRSRVLAEAEVHFVSE